MNYVRHWWNMYRVLYFVTFWDCVIALQSLRFYVVDKIKSMYSNKCELVIATTYLLSTIQSHNHPSNGHNLSLYSCLFSSLPLPYPFSNWPTMYVGYSSWETAYHRRHMMNRVKYADDMWKMMFEYPSVDLRYGLWTPSTM